MAERDIVCLRHGGCADHGKCYTLDRCDAVAFVDGETTSIPHSIEVAGYTFINPPYGAEATLMEGNRTVLTAKGATAIHALAAIVSLAVQGEAAQGAMDELRTSLRGLLGL
jgi:hypothetical protein